MAETIFGLSGALVYSRADGYRYPSPGDMCLLKCRGVWAGVRVCGPGPRVGWVRCRWPIDAATRPSGVPRDNRAFNVRAGRLQLVP